MKRRAQKTQEVDRATPPIALAQIAGLKKILPEAFSENKVDFSKLRAALGDLSEDRPERYSFSWAGKKDAIRVLQTPSRATFVPVEKESVSFDKTGNLFIEGDNLEALKLLYKSYFGQIKMIYIDPPYNTGNDFVYPDDYADPLRTYLELTKQKDAEGNLLTSNPETSGRYHSAWLSMMYPRLFLARQLLREDGVIFVSIDDHEIHNLRLILNEIFGEENFISQMVWKKKSNPPNNVEIGTVHEYILVYAKDLLHSALYLLERSEELDASYSNPDNDTRGSWKSGDLSAAAKGGRITPSLIYEIANPFNGEKHLPPKGRMWIVAKEQMEKNIRENRIWWGQDHIGKPKYKRFLSEVRQGVSTSSLLDKLGTNSSAARELSYLFKGALVFETPKPVQMIKRFVQITTPNEGGIILDFFAGSGTTAQAVIEQNAEDDGNRTFILVQLPEPNPVDSEARKAGYGTIADICKERVRRVIKKIGAGQAQHTLGGGKELDLGFKVFKLAESNYRSWSGVEEKEPDAYAKQMELFNDPLVNGWKPNNVIWEVAIKEGYSLNLRIELLKEIKANRVFLVTDVEKGPCFKVCLDDELKPVLLREAGLGKGELFVCRDVALSDELAANLALQCRLKTI